MDRKNNNSHFSSTLHMRISKHDFEMLINPQSTWEVKYSYPYSRFVALEPCREVESHSADSHKLPGQVGLISSNQPR